LHKFRKLLASILDDISHLLTYLLTYLDSNDLNYVDCRSVMSHWLLPVPKRPQNPMQVALWWRQWLWWYVWWTKLRRPHFSDR